MRMQSKQPDVYKQQRERRRRAYASTPNLSEQFPQVEQLVIRMTFTDPSGRANHSPQMHSFSPAGRAFFEVPCPFSACIDGGFDLNPIIADILNHSGQETSGTLDCQGWQSRDRSDQHRCLLKLHYTLSVCYKA